MSFDSSLNLFKRINELAGLYLSLPEQASMFSTKPMLLPVMFFCATKCRDWHTRRDTLRLVMNSPRREGFWTTSHFIGVLNHIFDVESAGLTPDDVIPPASRIDKMHLSPIDHTRVNIWYRRPHAPEEIANGADVDGKWTQVTI
jgi:hypothetical protein